MIIKIRAQNNEAAFMHLSKNNGLSNNEVKSILKDKRGFLWFGTEDGLNKFDGYKFTIYKNNERNPNSIGDNNIVAIVEDFEGNLWIGTDKGLIKFIYNTETFISFDSKQKKHVLLNDDKITKLFINHSNHLWVCYDNRVIQIDIKTGSRVNLINDTNVNNTLKGKTISCLFEDKQYNLWIGIWHIGLLRLNANMQKISFYSSNLKNTYTIPDNTIISMYQDNDYQLWIGTNSMGLCKYSYINKQFEKISCVNSNQIINIIPDENNKLWICQNHSVIVLNPTNLQSEQTYINNPLLNKSFTSGRALTYYKDNNNIVWVGSSEGITYTNPNIEKFTKWFHKFDKSNNTPKNYVTDFCKDLNNNIWISTFGNGLYCYNVLKNTIKHYTSIQTNVISDYINCITTINSNELWVGTLQGISVFNTVSFKANKQIKHNAIDTNSLYHNNVQKIYKDSRNNIWIATQESLDVLKENTFKHYTRSNLKGLSNYKITYILEDNDNNIWLASNNGLNKYNLIQNSNTKYYYEPETKNSISSSDIYTIFKDSKNEIWLGTRNGLNKYNKYNNTFKYYGILSNNANNMIFKIYEDENYNIWVVTSEGLLKLHGNNLVNKFDENDGLHINQSLLKGNNGNIFIGGRDGGFYMFNPNTITTNTIKPPIYITNFLLFNKAIPIDANNNKAILKKHITITNNIELSNDKSMLSFEFTALNYILPLKNQYAYKMEGFDKQWNYVLSDKRHATYTNLNPGKYIFKVKGSNNDGVWNEKGQSIEITIHPPFWYSKIAFLIYFILIILLLITFRLIILKSHRIKEKINLEKQFAKNVHEIDLMKLNFFANISHEFRTPLTLILNPLAQLIKNTPDNETSRQLNLIQRNAQRLNELTNQLLDLQKLTAGSLKPEIFYTNILEFTNEILQRFEPLVVSKGITNKLICNNNKIEGWIDPDKTEKILVNLLSNAYKFTNNVVIININEINNNLNISVTDNGKGIPKGKEDKIFDRFYQTDSLLTRIQEGSGIGLSIVKELVKLLNGTISVTNQQGYGACFTLTLPLNENAYNNYTLKEEYVPNKDIINNYSQPPFISNNYLTNNNELILIVEDNNDLRKYLASILHNSYNIIEAENGNEGINKAYEFIPDLIISDIMMPNTDGIELTSVIKNDLRTNHIPIILLTALTTSENQIKGLQSGANDYLTKPFSEEMLLLKINNLFVLRRNQQEIFKQNFKHEQLNDENYTVKTYNNEFLDQIITVINNNIEDKDFNVEKLAFEMGMAISVLFRKLKAIGDYSPGNLIRDVRLKKAIELLATKKYNVSEVAYLLGFSDVKSFRRSFKSHFNKLPSSFLPS